MITIETIKATLCLRYYKQKSIKLIYVKIPLITCEITKTYIKVIDYLKSVKYNCYHGKIKLICLTIKMQLIFMTTTYLYSFKTVNKCILFLQQKALVGRERLQYATPAVNATSLARTCQQLLPVILSFYKP